MAKRERPERRFSEALDRLLAGETVTLGPDADPELRECFEFAREMAALRPAPDEAFARLLQARLLEQLRQREAARAARTGFWERLRRQPVWPAVVTVVFVVILAALLWRAGVFPTQAPSPTVTPTTTATSSPTATMTTTATATPTTTATTTATQPGGVVVSLEAGASTDRGTYAPGEPVAITVTLANTGPTAVVLNDMPPIVSVLSAVTREPVYTFAAGDRSVTLGTAKQVSFELTWDQRDFNGQPVTGSYYIELEDLNYGDQPVPLPLQTPAPFEIIPTR